MNYTVDVNKGFFIVAYPEENMDTAFEFEYWVAPPEIDIRI